MDGSRRGFLKLAGSSVLGAISLAWSKPQVGPGGSSKVLGKALNGKSWGMVVDMGKCLKKEGCTACIETCHQTHNVPAISESEEEVKWIWKEEFEHVFPDLTHQRLGNDLKHQDVLVMCNHCENPPCVRVCPTGATWKRETDGLVMMDQHRCVGCRYCIVACPYGSRSFNWSDPRKVLKEKLNVNYPTRTKGVVEKCNFCAERLARGEIPACVEACEKSGSGCLTFGDLGDPNSKVTKGLKSRFSIRRKPGLGTEPQIYYLV